MANVNGQGRTQHNKGSHSRDQIEAMQPRAKARDDLKGAFAGDKNDQEHGTHTKSRKISESYPEDAGKVPKR